MTQTISRQLLDILACPKCKEAVELGPKSDVLICKRCKLVYEIRQGIPIMLVDEAQPLDEYLKREE